MSDLKPIILDETGQGIKDAIEQNTAAIIAAQNASYDEDATLLEMRDARTIEGTSYVSLGLGLRTEFAKTAKQSELQQESADRKAEVAVERARIDAFTKMEAGSTTGDAELMDIRVGADGVTYENAGAAVRGQFGQLSSEIHNLNSGWNLIADKSSFTIVNDKYINASDGTIYDGDGYCISEPFKLKKGDMITLSGIGIDTLVGMICVCDENNSERICLVRSIDTTKQSYVYTAPADMYITLSFATSEYDIKVYRHSNELDSTINKSIKANVNPLSVNLVKKMIYNNTYTEHSNYCCSTPIYLGKGEKLIANMRCESVVSALSKSTFNGEIISSIALGLGNTLTEYSYIADEDCYIVLSFYVERNSNADFNAISYYPVYDIIENSLDEMSFSMFETWGIIGDSFASGVYYDSTKGAMDNHLQKSWCQILARQSGNKCVNFSIGGLYCATWLENKDRGLTFLLSESAKELYIIALGINDVARLSGVQPLGTISDINEDFTNNPNTFYGNYGKIIGNIKNHAPKAKIILSTIPYIFTDAMAINNAIISIAEHFGLPCLMVHTDKFFRSEYYWNNFENDHPKSFLYSATANAYNRLICKSLKNDTSYWGDTFN